MFSLCFVQVRGARDFYRSVSTFCAKLLSSARYVEQKVEDLHVNLQLFVDAAILTKSIVNN